ncbi:MAG: Uma2 family endonuclease [Pirellulaceae bacterium]|nr:Uma2 family endonuclease [Pirellulaceae bacterium]
MPIIVSAENRTLLDNIRWETFVELSEQRRGSIPRMTYDRGLLELMSPLRQHEQIGSLIGRLVETYSEVRDIEIKTVASTTFKRKDLQSAFEADESYYIAHAEQIRSKPEIDLAIDPPPDLVIEVEITSSALRKLELFAAMGIPEVWRHDGERLQMYRLVDAAYEPIATSDGLPSLSIAMIESILAERFEKGETSLMKQFRASLATSKNIGPIDG